MPFLRCPQYVICNLIRFHENGTSNMTRIALSPTIDLRQFIRRSDSQTTTPATYQLIAVGVSPFSCWHYTLQLIVSNTHQQHYENIYVRHWKAQVCCSTQDKTAIWYTIDDNFVAPCSNTPWAEPSSSATLLLFKRVEHSIDMEPVPTPAASSGNQPTQSYDTPAPTVPSEPTQSLSPVTTPSGTPDSEKQPQATPSAPVAQTINLPSDSSPAPVQPQSAVSTSAASAQPGSVRLSIIHIIFELERVTPEDISTWLKNRFNLVASCITPASSGFFVEFSPPVQIRELDLARPPKMQTKAVPHLLPCQHQLYLSYSSIGRACPRSGLHFSVCHCCAERAARLY